MDWHHCCLDFKLEDLSVKSLVSELKMLGEINGCMYLSQSQKDTKKGALLSLSETSAPRDV